MMLAVASLVALILTMAYFRISALVWTSALAVWLIGLEAGEQLAISPILWGAFVLLAAVVNLPPLRRRLLSAPAFALYEHLRPSLSRTEKEALDAGTVWWDGELFSGTPNWRKLLAFPDLRLTAEEQAFLDGPVEQLCSLLDEWQITHELRDLPPDAWRFMREKGFLGLIIPKRYGGLELSNYGHAKVVTKIATRAGAAAVTVMVPNSLGPGELLQRYGTEAQKDYYLPRLARGLEIPCFALTSPSAGSDAGSIPDYGYVCRGSYTDPRTGERRENVLGMRVSWEKRWITLAPVATLLGLAFRLYDPDGLLGAQREIGITCALVPVEHEGVCIGRRHWPAGSAFMNGPTWGREVFMPIDWIVGGPKYAGQGWRMLVECLSVGRCISLPAIAVAAGKVASFSTGAYARVRDQFGVPIGTFEGVDEALARIGGHTYQMEAAQDLALTGLDLGEKPAVLSAVLKYHNTERMRKVLNDAMDVHGGRTVMLGPRNYLAGACQLIPVAITVEGANILTRSMIIFGQGAIRCHPFALREMQAVQAGDLEGFDQAFSEHVGFTISNLARSLWMGLTGSRLIMGVPRSREVIRHYRALTRYSSAFALLADVALARLGGALKVREKLSARLGDMLSGLYVASACLRRFDRDGAHPEDVPLLTWGVEAALYDIQQAMDGFLANFPSRALAWALRRAIFPWGLTRKAPSDHTGTAVAHGLMTPGGPRERLTRGMHLPGEGREPLAVLEAALHAVQESEAIERRLRKLSRAGKLIALTERERLAEARDLHIITAEEYAAVARARKLKRQVIMVDDFDTGLTRHDERLLERTVF